MTFDVKTTEPVDMYYWEVIVVYLNFILKKKVFSF